MDEYNIKDCLLRTMEQIKADYKTNKLCHEGTFESAIYRYLSNELELRLGKNTKIWCQVKLRKEDKSLVSVDIGIVDINSSSDSPHIKNSISKIHALIELKFTRVSKKTFDTFQELKEQDALSIKKLGKLNGAIGKDIKRLQDFQKTCNLMDNSNTTPIHINNTYFCICCEYFRKEKVFTQLMLSQNNKVIYNSSI